MLEKVKAADPRVVRTRQLLREALMGLLLEKSLQSVSVQDIAARATVNRATFYAHYVDKYALLNDMIDETFQQALAKHLPADAQLSPENVRLLLEAVCEYLAALYHSCSHSRASQFEPLVEEAVKKQVTEVLRSWLRPPKGTKGAADTSEVNVTVSSWAIYGAAQQWGRAAKRLPLKEFVDQVMPMIMAGMNSGAGRG